MKRHFLWVLLAFFAGCGSNGTSVVSAENESAPASVSYGADLAGASPSSIVEGSDAILASAQPADAAAPLPVSGGEAGVCLSDLSPELSSWISQANAYDGSWEESCKVLRYRDSQGNEIMVIKLHGECTLDIEMSFSTFQMDTTFNICE
jgi:hypothetical protein